MTLYRGIPSSKMSLQLTSDSCPGICIQCINNLFVLCSTSLTYEQARIVIQDVKSGELVKIEAFAGKFNRGVNLLLLHNAF